MKAKRVENKASSNGLAPNPTSRREDTLLATGVPQDFFKVYREALEHPMFRGHLDWIGAWMLIQAAADRQNGRVNLTAVGRTVCRDFGWNNDRWRRFVRRLQKENFIAVVEKKNLGDKVGHIHIALVLFSTWSNQELVVAPFDAVRVHTGVPHEEIVTSARSEERSNTAAVVVAAEALVEQNEEEPVWLVIADDES